MRNNRDYAYFVDQRVAVAMHTVDKLFNCKKKKLTVALAFCNWRDQFEKRTARSILNGRLDTRLKTGDNVRCTFELFYEGETPRRDVFFKITEAIRENLAEGDEAYAREHIGVVCAKHIIAAAVSSPTSLVAL